MTTIKIKNNNYQNKKALWKERFPHKALDMIIQINTYAFLIQLTIHAPTSVVP